MSVDYLTNVKFRGVKQVSVECHQKCTTVFVAMSGDSLDYHLKQSLLSGLMSLFDIRRKRALPTAETALGGRSVAMPVTNSHAVSGHPICPPFPDHLAVAMFGMGCFWGVEKKFWQVQGVFTTAVGYAAGVTPNPNYKEVCSGQTGHNEVVLVVFDPEQISYHALLRLFWEGHNPTQGMRQGNDLGTQYRSGIYYFDQDQRDAAIGSRGRYQQGLTASGFGEITTEICDAPIFYYAEDYHQQYLHKNPAGYCGLGGTGVVCPVGTGVDESLPQSG